MQKLALAVNTLCVDEPNYEKAQTIFKQYANFTRFLERVQSGEEINKRAKQTPRATIFKVSNDKSYPREVCARADRKLFA